MSRVLIACMSVASISVAVSKIFNKTNILFYSILAVAVAVAVAVASCSSSRSSSRSSSHSSNCSSIGAEAITVAVTEV